MTYRSDLRRCLAAAAIGAVLGVPLAAAALAARIVTVSQVGRAFSVAALHLQRGDSVHFTNDDIFDHQLYSDSPGFKFESDEQPPGSAKDIQFTKAGTFDIQCQIHPRMHLAVTVD